MKNTEFGPNLFEELMKCGTYNYGHPSGTSLHRLVDHGFVANRACIWGSPELEGYEIAVIARTYCDDKTIDNPPDGLHCMRLPKKVMGVVDCGTPIAIVVTKKTAAAEELLKGCCYMPADMIAFTLPQHMTIDGYMVALPVIYGTNTPGVKIVKL